MRSKFKWIFTLLMAFSIQFSFAQERTITGTVSEEMGPLPGATVVVKGTNKGTTTDFDGQYSISAKQGDVLEISFVGMKTQSITVGTANTYNATLEPDNILGEVVVRGYSTVSSAKSTLASQTVTAKTIENRPNTNAMQTLQGQVAGLTIAAQTGQPGAPPVVRLRGTSSIGGANEPLYIIDGMPTTAGAFTNINPNDIESVSVLKDAAATSIYGNRGANGVIIVKTRRGSFEKGLEINYSGWTSFSQLQTTQDYNLMNSQETLRLEREYGNGLGTTLTDAEIDAYGTFNWLNYFFRTSVSQNHNLRLTSGGKNTNQATTFGYTDTQGVLQNTNLKRFNFRNNASMKSNNEKFSLNTNISLNFTKENDPGSIGTGGVNQNYVLGAFQSVGYITPDDYVDGASLLAPLLFRNTPLMLMDKLKTFDRIFEEFRGLASVDARYKILDNLSVGSTTSIDYLHRTTTTFQAPEAFNSLLFAPGGAANQTPGFQDFQTDRQFMINQVMSLNWEKEFGKHTLGLGAYTEYFKAHRRVFGVRVNGMNPATWYPGDGGGFVGDVATNDWFVDVGRALYRDAGLFSYFGQADYDYDERFGASATVRRDASFRFAETNRWGTFWSIGARWNITKESFMDGSAFDMLKLRASYGTQGNQNIQNTDYWGASRLFQNTWGTGGGYQGAASILLTGIGNDALRWEQLSTANVGIDFGVWNSRLRGAVDVYKKVTDDLFIFGPTSLTTGISGLNQNLGSMENSGVELQLAYDIIAPKAQGDFGFSVNAVGAYNKNKLTDLGLGRDEILGTGRVGGPLGEYFLIPFVGVNPENGNLLFLDINGNETETPDAATDRRWTGKNILPDFEGSFGFNIDYKGFYLQTQFNYVIGSHRFDFDLAGYHNPGSIGDFRLSRDVLDAWTPTNTTGSMPSLFAANSTAFDGVSDRYLFKRDFLRLRFASFGYGFNSKQLQGTGISNLRLYVNAENMLTFTNWRGFDPEQLNNDSRLYPTPKTVSVGLEIGF